MGMKTGEVINMKDDIKCY